MGTIVGVSLHANGPSHYRVSTRPQRRMGAWPSYPLPGLILDKVPCVMEKPENCLSKGFLCLHISTQPTSLSNHMRQETQRLGPWNSNLPLSITASPISPPNMTTGFGAPLLQNEKVYICKQEYIVVIQYESEKKNVLQSLYMHQTPGSL